MAKAVKQNPRLPMIQRLPLIRMVGSMNRDERLSFARHLLGHSLSRRAKRSLMSAHNAEGRNRIRKKARLLKRDFKASEIRLLMATNTTGRKKVGFLDVLNSLGGDCGLWENPYIRARRKGYSASTPGGGFERANGRPGEAGILENPAILHRRVRGVSY
jgi:hypothetical protein